MLNKRIEKLEQKFFSDASKLDDLVMSRIVFRSLLRQYSYAEVVEGCQKHYPDIPIELITMKATGKLKTAETEALAQMERGRARMTDEEAIREISLRLHKKGWETNLIIEATMRKYPNLEPSEIERLVKLGVGENDKKAN